MSLIDKSYFTGELVITNTNLPVIEDALEATITKYEKEILKSLLGQVLYDAFIAGLLEDPIPEKWTDLRDGKDFTQDYNGQTITLHWNGLINDEKRSLISYYVYCKYWQHRQTLTTDIGEIDPKAENASKWNTIDKIVNCWREMRQLYGVVPKSYSKYYDTTHIVYNDLPSAYNFLLANSSNYDDWWFEQIPIMNAIGI